MFAEILESMMTKVEGALGAVIMGMDGISIGKSRTLERWLLLEMLAAEYTSLLRFIFRQFRNELPAPWRSLSFAPVIPESLWLRW